MDQTAALRSWPGRNGSFQAWLRRPEHRLWPLALAMAAGAAVLLDQLPRGQDAAGHPPVWIWPIAFALAEVCIVRIHFRHDAHTFSLSDIALVAGLFLADPIPLVIGRVVGTVAVLVVVRRQPLRKVVFNGALVGLSTAIAVAVMVALAVGQSADTPSACGAAIIAALAGETVSMGAIHVTLFVVQGTAPLETLPRALGFGAAGVLVNGSAGLLIAVATPMHAWAPLLIVAPAATVLGIYRSYTRERREHQRAEFLYESASSLQRSSVDGDPVSDLLTRVRGLLGAEVVELIVVGAGGADELFVAAGAAGSFSSELIPADRHRVILVADGLASEPRIVDKRAPSTTARVLLGRSAEQAIVVPLAAERGLRGALLATIDRTAIRRLDGGDARLMGALSSHIVSYLETTRLGRQLEHQAFHDGLTQLANRVLLSRRIDEAIALRTPDGPSVALLFVDLDDFKLVNDAFGHAVGDRLLQALADRLLGVVSDRGIVARLGGDEFAVLLWDSSGAEPVAAAVLEALDQPVAITHSNLVVHASIGIAIAGAEDDSESLLRHADLAMYRAKGCGKRRFDVFDQTLQDDVLQQQAIRSDLERAAIRGQLELRYQPIVNLSTRMITGVEALVRWRHPARGLLPPDKFIPMAEETGLIVPLGDWVLRAAIAEVAGWHRRNPAAERVRLSVNVAARQLGQFDFADAALAALEEHGLQADHLVVEITEGSLLSNRDLALRHIEQLRAAGVRIAIDDFGTGYSSLGYLRTLPIDIVKIDKTFVSGLAANDGHQALTLAIVRLLSAIDVDTVAEGIETEQQLAYVSAMGCDSGQGYLFARPADGDTVLGMIGSGPLIREVEAIAG